MKNYIYTPRADYFKCRVPLKEAHQAFVVDGQLQQDENSALQRGENGKGYNVVFKRNMHAGQILQIISVRSHDLENTLEYKNSITVEENSEASLLLCFQTFTMNGFETKEELDIDIAQSGRLDLIIMQNEHNKSCHNTAINITMGRDALCKIHVITLHGGKIGKMPFEQLAVGQHGRGFHGVAQGVKIDFFALPDKMIEGSKSGIGQNCPAQLAEIVTPQKRLFAAEKKTTLCLSCFQAGAQFSNFHDLPPLF